MNQLLFFLPMFIILAAFMFFASRRQRRTVQATIDLQESLRVGDRVHTTSGLRGVITAITDDDVELEIAPGVLTTWMKLAIRDRIVPETPEAEVADGGEVADDIAELTAEPERLPKD
jgi:preprotein translocase subunit YajC